jgi:hypothetical protein
MMMMIYISLMLLQDESVLIMNSIDDDDVYIIHVAAGSICFDHMIKVLSESSYASRFDVYR